ncbi:amino acid adenylation domain-containing protein [Lysobacter sp. CA199]|uniref:amino acid adenylation domain-containing protein n=1 Tax=Lysobacter sp. CA199 TaxID=3455608 RepID=UPI003F8D7485
MQPTLSLPAASGPSFFFDPGDGTDAQNRCVHRWFERQVRRTPDAAALIHNGRSLSYAQLNAQANLLAQRMIALGVAPDDRVALCAERGFAAIAGLLAVLKAGAAFVPLDTGYPIARLTYLLEDSAPTLLLGDAAGRALLGEAACAGRRWLDLDAALASGERPEHDADPYIAALNERHLAYVIYTSGSTGTPKGVAMPHAPLADLIAWQLAQTVSPQRTLQFAALGFDVALQEIFATLCSGASLVLIDARTRLDHAELIRTVCAQRVQRLYLPYLALQSLAEAFDAADASLADTLGETLQDVIVAGEQLRLTPQIRRLFGRLPQCRLHNHYGPTESHVVAARVFGDGLERVPDHAPIGRPIANARLYLLDASGQPVAPGETGELYIGGGAVARGYLHRPDLTDERFLADPFDPRDGARMYRTGDLARRQDDGDFVFLGRNDQQIKLRGFRVEPGEIEACLSAHPSVREAAVLARDNAAGEKRLIAYLVPARWPASDGFTTDLRDHLLTHLPDYMIPAAVVALPALPLTAHGKLDRDALPEPGDEALVRPAYEPVQGEMETALAALWQTLLAIERIGRDDDFFELGGHSLIAARLLGRLRRRFGVEFPLTVLLTHTRLRTQAQALNESMAQAPAALPPILPGERADTLPLSFAQQRLWFVSQWEGASATYHIPLALRLRGALDAAALRGAFERVFSRHEALRSSFVGIDGVPRIRLLAADQAPPIVAHDLRRSADPQDELSRLIADEIHAPFDLSRGPLIRARLIRIGEDEHVFVLTQHHIVSDGWSMDVLAREFGALYRAFAENRPDPLPALNIQYPDYAIWQARWLDEAHLRPQADYWRQALAGAPALLELPSDRPRPPQQSFAGAMLPLRVDADLTAALERLGRRHGTTLFMTVLAAWSLVLARLSGQDDVVVGAPNAHRDRAEIEPLIGFFVNTAALRIDLSGAPDVADLLARVRGVVLGAQDHQDLPFERVVEIAQPPRRNDHTPLFQAMFAWQGPAPAAFELGALTAEPMELPVGTAKFDLELQLGESADGLVGGLTYATALFDPGTIERHHDYLLAALRAMVADDAQPLAHIELLGQDERALLLETWNATDAAYPDHSCLHQLFEQQARLNPEATALFHDGGLHDGRLHDDELHDGRRTSYAELNTKANRLAHYLIESGVRPDDRVALCAQRGPDAIVGLLAVLKAGGAYVPFDPAHSSERLNRILADADPLLVLGDAAGRRALGDLRGLTWLDLHADRAVWSRHAAVDPRVESLRPQHLAYIIYTSGSTGTPKGVMVEHRNAVQFASSQIARFGVDADSRIAQFASLSFDASIIDLGLSLGAGAALYLPGEAERADAGAYMAWIASNGITHSYLPPAFLQGQTDLPQFERKPTFLVGGETVSPALIRALGRHAKVVHVYGPTETTVLATAWDPPEDMGERDRAPIGRPLANTRAYLLDAQRRPVPLGAPGELYIGGAGVTRGYLNQAELTAERFFADPFDPRPGARMYRSGDLARYLGNGDLLFLGRNDHQVKLRGFRIELGEIDARLTEHPSIREAVTVAREDDPGHPRLVAYLVRSTDPMDDFAAVLRAHLSALLPDYMVPAAFVVLPELPVNASGKVDRKALPPPDGDAFAHRRYVPPHSEIEILVAGLWQDLLKLERVGRDDDFFELGGHSLLAMRLLGRLQSEFGVTVPPSMLFNHPRLSAFAEVVLIAAIQADA